MDGFYGMSGPYIVLILKKIRPNPYIKGGGADVPLFETIKTNAGNQPKNELQQ